MERMSRRISIDRDAVSVFRRRHHITRLALFGSALRDDFGPGSDADVLVAGDVLQQAEAHRQAHAMLQSRVPASAQSLLRQSHIGPSQASAHASIAPSAAACQVKPRVY
jgi:predicted nucleotidyltransferase